MNKNTLIGVILIAVGIIALVFQGITYKTREKAVDLGPIQVTTERTRSIPLPPIVGAIAIVGGVVVLVVKSRKG
jgi:uncharacterized membrane protein YidH (DUF202 family)